MTNYEQLMAKSEHCLSLAVEFYKKGDRMLGTFWENAGDEMKRRALALSVEQAELGVV